MFPTFKKYWVDIRENVYQFVIVATLLFTAGWGTAMWVFEPKHAPVPEWYQNLDK